MIKKTLATMILASTFVMSSMSFAASLEDNMKTLAKNYKAFNQSNNAADANKALDNMRVAANDAKKVKLKGRGDTQALSSTQLYDQIIAEIDKTQSLVKGGHLDHAKIEAKKIAEIRDQGHKIYR
ncbi:cytochrome b562 [Acinetobacter sichuanensis]|uniref:ATP-binding protein n=1 Tax=Acinetobacter sichuanensis TaxID=2136183 RepID=A0A371YTD7_9GAMM|nr:cytochrome b562 [Acinetobacter sichuanensis]MDQ9021654.1 cytochrome b562 [Acinetobacter sichuanensis]RFC84733.1 ATP-binding protein [Acinetobacter sichuanensis]